MNRISRFSNENNFTLEFEAVVTNHLQYGCQ